LFARPVSADPDAANQAYQRALEHLEAGELEQAQEAFARAYRESPHYLVLYNLGVVSLERGHAEAARGYFEDFLEQGGDAVSAEQRAKVEELIARTRRDDAAAPGDSEDADAFQEPVSDPPSAKFPRVPSRAEPEDERGKMASDHSEGAMRRAAGATASERARWGSRKTLAITLGATGAALILSGASVLVWNQNRYSDYERARSELDDAVPPGEVTSQEDLRAWLAFTRAEEQNKAELASVRRFDVVGWSLAGVGAALLATGVVLHLMPESKTAVTVTARRAALSFVW
jgi:tetratricopeptide (TPR) repeat protein